MLVSVIVMSVAGCAMSQLRVTITAEGEWKNPLTGEKKQATIKPLVLLQPADGSNEPRRVQSFSGLDWQLWESVSPVTLTIQIQSDQTLSGVEITFNEREQKFVPAHHPLTMTAKAQGNLANNEITVTVFVHESGRIIPKWKLLIRPERRGQPVRFLLEVPVLVDENSKQYLPQQLFPLKWEGGTVISEISTEPLRQKGSLAERFPIRSLYWVFLHGASRKGLKLLGVPNLAPSTSKDKELLVRWGQLIANMPRQFQTNEAEKGHFVLSAFHKGKVIIRYKVTAKGLMEVMGMLEESADLLKVRERLQSLAMSLPPISLMPSPGDVIRQMIYQLKRELTREETKQFLERHLELLRKQDAELTEVVGKHAKQLGLVVLQAKVIYQCITFEPKEVERQLRPLMLTLKVQLQGEATCAYHRQKHIIPLSGEVRFTPLKPSLDSPSPLAEHRRLHWEGIPDEPVEISVPKEGSVEVQLPAAWFNRWVSEGVQVDASAEGWQPFKTRLSYDYELFQPQKPIPLTIRLTPTHAEEANFLLELPFEAKLKHATIVVQDEKGKVIASQTAQWLVDFESHGIVIKKLPYGAYRIAAEGSFTIDGKEHAFSVVQTFHVNDYHDVLELRVERSR
jgi:hypothetical protein